MWSVYILQNQNTGWKYVGCTSDLTRRLKEHNNGYNKSTTKHRPLKLIYQEDYASQEQAFAREKMLKSYKGGEGLKKLLRS